MSRSDLVRLVRLYRKRDRGGGLPTPPSSPGQTGNNNINNNNNNGNGAGNGAANSKSAHLSPAMYTVHSHHGVRKLRLGRTASISTQMELNQLPTDRHEDYVDKISSMFRQGQALASYFESALFADNLIELCKRVALILEKEKRLLELRSPVYVFGDLHGNVDDLKFFSEHVWPLGMPLTAGTFLFLGDYVDRGQGGLEVVAYLFAQKVQVPEKIFLLRGNHETRAVNGWEEYYRGGSFLWQCKKRFGNTKGTQVWDICNQVFDRMPFAAIVDKSVFCVHGGIPRPTGVTPEEDNRLEDIRRIPCPHRRAAARRGRGPAQSPGLLAAVV